MFAKIARDVAAGGGSLREWRGRWSEHEMGVGLEGQNEVVLENLERNRERTLLRLLLIRQISMSGMVRLMKTVIVLPSLRFPQGAVPSQRLHRR